MQVGNNQSHSSKAYVRVATVVILSASNSTVSALLLDNTVFQGIVIALPATTIFSMKESELEQSKPL